MGIGQNAMFGFHEKGIAACGEGEREGDPSRRQARLSRGAPSPTLPSPLFSLSLSRCLALTSTPPLHPSSLVPTYTPQLALSLSPRVHPKRRKCIPSFFFCLFFPSSLVVCVCICVCVARYRSHVSVHPYPHVAGEYSKSTPPSIIHLYYTHTSLSI
ncbi:hypothetical protein GGS23DRAFT_572782 [Durotheca rogersii]|uniref:uncharacterized protein n=1 Tax=Durotheca rogersii TaxID=419775 RepID=UPI0022205F10|nr:uncharacterized protein GGS23DRAFT_572782 [Durotheca rogersii]KAI5862118.1 hypothetical protein GGS23DRAFT_572782 [Durotheca rogersii]